MYQSGFKNRYGNSGYSGGRKRFGGGFSNRRNFNKSFHRNSGNIRIDINKFINKAAPVREENYQARNSFFDFELDARLKQNIIAKGFTVPMPIQDQALPHILVGKDLIGIANTGMGKTAAFLIPLIDKVVKNRYQKVLIITPTRELALQIQEDLISLSRGLNIWSVICIGGTGIGRQLSDLRHRKFQFIIGTPGRLKDLYNRKVLVLSAFQNVVVDEVDRMFDMGFTKDIKFLLDQLPKQRQSLFFSATVSRQIETLIQNYSQLPVTVSVKIRDTAASIDQDVVRIQTQAKIEVLHDLLIKQDFKKVLIFGKTKHGVQKLSVELKQRGFKSESIHGNKSQHQRQSALKMFKTNQINILVATDVAARGLDIPNVSHVINYDLPQTYDDYIHRIGRTGRANTFGRALTFI